MRTRILIFNVHFSLLSSAFLASGATAQSAEMPALKDAYKDYFHVGVAINRDIAMDSIARTDGHARRSIQRDADQKINAILTEDQKALYQQWKQQQKLRMQQRREQNQESNNP